MPPLPSGSTISYGPRRVPATSVIRACASPPRGARPHETADRSDGPPTSPRTVRRASCCLPHRAARDRGAMADKCRRHGDVVQQRGRVAMTRVGRVFQEPLRLLLDAGQLLDGGRVVHGLVQQVGVRRRRGPARFRRHDEERLDLGFAEIRFHSTAMTAWSSLSISSSEPTSLAMRFAQKCAEMARGGFRPAARRSFRRARTLSRPRATAADDRDPARSDGRTARSADAGPSASHRVSSLVTAIATRLRAQARSSSASGPWRRLGGDASPSPPRGRRAGPRG